MHLCVRVHLRAFRTLLLSFHTMEHLKRVTPLIFSAQNVYTFLTSSCVLHTLPVLVFISALPQLTFPTQYFGPTHPKCTYFSMAVQVSHPCLTTTGYRGKAIPLQAWRGPDGSRRLRLPDFKTTGT